MSAVNASDSHVGWMSEPSTRGTWGILSSCLLTLVLCVYTALHMNVPFRGESWCKRQLTIAAWVLVGIFAPEIVVYTSWAQWSDARHLQRDIERLRAQKGDEASNLLKSWSMTHSFYVVMGGIQLDLPKTDGEGWFKDKRKVEPSLRLTPTCIVYLLWVDAPLPDISAQDIADRSKASALTKFLSCTQALWLVIQLIGRTYSGLVVTELEVNTLAHVLCAFAMYGFWFSKPFLVEQAHRIKLESELGGILAYHNLFLSSDRNISRSFPPHAVFSFLVCGHEPDWDEIYQGLWTNGSTLIIAFRTIRNYNHELVKQRIYSTLKAREGRNMPNVVMLRQRENILSNEDQPPCRTNYNPEYQDWDLEWISGWDLHSWIRHWSADETPTVLRTSEQEYEDFCSEFPHHSRDKPNTRFLSSRTNMLRSFEDHGDHDWVRASAMLFLSGFYSVIHLTLWYSVFPTVAEAWLWRISSLVISGCAVALAITSLTWFCDDLVIDKLSKLRTAVLARVNKSSGSIGVQLVRVLLIGPLIAVFGFLWVIGNLVVWASVGASAVLLFAYIGARLFLVLESFASLRSQPPSAYQIPQWIQILPHL